MTDVVYFSVNNWFCGRDYPDTPKFREWLGNDLKQSFRNEEWVKENKLCVRCGNIDMSANYCVTAPKEWVMENCPELLSGDEFEYQVQRYGSKGNEILTYKKKFSDFVYKPDEYGDVEDSFGWPFLEYCEENIGIQHYEDPSESCDDDEEDNEETES